MPSPAGAARALTAVPHFETDEVQLIINLPDGSDLAPMITRQRLVIEGTCAKPITEAGIREYLSRLSDVCGMTALMEPVTHRSEAYGWAGWIHWEASGAHFYAWEQPMLFFSVDIYACKPFDAIETVRFTREYFDAGKVVARVF
jgi:hypothetical protein